MPRRPKRPCPGSPGRPRCAALVEAGQRRCPECQAATYKAQDRDRPSASKRGYDRHWQRLRRMYLNSFPLCECGCGYAAEEVHHLDGDSSNNSWENLQALTKVCHSRVTAKEKGLHG